MIEKWVRQAYEYEKTLATAKALLIDPENADTLLREVAEHAAQTGRTLDWKHVREQLVIGAITRG